MTGEQTHELGREGARRAKEWLEATTRADVPWVNPDAAHKLTFEWATGNKFSFDLGGRLRDDEFDGKEFFAESKLYGAPGDQGTLYREYLAKCYRAFQVLPQRCDVFMWITWAPFLVNKWGELRAPKMVKDCVEGEAERAVGEGALSDQVIEEVSRRLWLLVLSEEHELMVPSREHRGIIERYRIDPAGKS